jgi:hypothetical protein
MARNPPPALDFAASTLKDIPAAAPFDRILNAIPTAKATQRLRLVAALNNLARAGFGSKMTTPHPTAPSKDTIWGAGAFQNLIDAAADPDDTTALTVRATVNCSR